jgi:hypothetical protein
MFGIIFFPCPLSQIKIRAFEAYIYKDRNDVFADLQIFRPAKNLVRKSEIRKLLMNEFANPQITSFTEGPLIYELFKPAILQICDLQNLFADRPPSRRYGISYSSKN